MLPNACICMSTAHEGCSSWMSNEATVAESCSSRIKKYPHKNSKQNRTQEPVTVTQIKIWIELIPWWNHLYSFKSPTECVLAVICIIFSMKNSNISFFLQISLFLFDCLLWLSDVITTWNSWIFNYKHLQNSGLTILMVKTAFLLISWTRLELCIAIRWIGEYPSMKVTGNASKSITMQPLSHCLHLSHSFDIKQSVVSAI